MANNMKIGFWGAGEMAEGILSAIPSKKSVIMAETREERAAELKKKYTIVIVTHNMQQALRISDKTAFFLLGDLIEMDTTDNIFTKPKDKRCEDYVTGRFG